MPKISDDQRQARRDQILAATWRCFSRKGIHSTSMEEIIREADLSAGAVYLYYKSKDDLIFAAISTYMAELRGLLMPILITENALPPSAFVHEIASVIAKHTKRLGVDLNVIILMCWSEAQTNKDVKALVRGFQLKFREALVNIVRQWQKRKELQSAGNPEDQAKALLAFFLGFIAQSALLGGLDPETVTRGMEGFLGNIKTVKSPARKRQD
jgi:TetR/AcrR family transcriptional regulator, transcriptional repressor of aconitase